MDPTPIFRDTTPTFGYFTSPQDWLIIMLLGGCISLILSIWATIDCAGKKFESDTVKVLWILVSLLLSPLGPIAYFLAGRKMAK